jgi:hypothetical protein
LPPSIISEKLSKNNKKAGKTNTNKPFPLYKVAAITTTAALIKQVKKSAPVSTGNENADITAPSVQKTASKINTPLPQQIKTRLVEVDFSLFCSLFGSINS